MYGGIPIKEIQDEYIQEVLDGFDVSVVLMHKDSEYMKFKDEIKNKSQIRQILGDVSDSVIRQFERWWDKYGISFAQIDSEVQESEVLMHGYLKELGYE